ncbi:MAG: LacI family DNA-binding transcriptional regulator [Burkholderiaceae bacterium]
MTAKPGRKPTMLDVAQRAAVSVGTVSNVLNAAANVSELRRARVQAAMRELGFLPNGAAQSLRRNQSRVIGLCTPLTSSAYFAALLEYFEEVAAKENYAVMQVLSHGDPALELRRVEALLRRNIDGLILIPTYDARATLDLLAARAVPTVIVDRVTEDKRFDYVAIDDRKAMHDATTHLIGLGHRRLLYLVRDTRLPTTRLRIEGYQDAADAARRTVSALVVQRDPDDAAFAAQLSAILQGRSMPTAIIASNSMVALSLIQILQKLGVRCPVDVSLLAFDEPVWAPILNPPLAVVRHPTERIAIEAWHRLLARVRTPSLRPQRITLQARLVVTASLAAPRTGVAR